RARDARRAAAVGDGARAAACGGGTSRRPGAHGRRYRERAAGGGSERRRRESARAFAVDAVAPASRSAALMEMVEPLPASDAAAAPAEAVGEPRKLVVFGGLILVLLLAALDSTIVATALPTIVGELGGLERLSWVVTAYLLAQTVVMPLYGKLGDLYGRKRVLQVAVLIFLAGSALCGLSRSMLQLILFRA